MVESGLVRTLAVQTAPHRVYALHPGVVGDSTKWRDVQPPMSRGVNAIDLYVDGGTRMA